MTLVAGIDLSAHSTTIVLCNADDGTIVRQGKAQHPHVSECDPRVWWDALIAAGKDILGHATAVAVAGQRHAMVTLDSAGLPVRPALLPNDFRAAGQARALLHEFGGATEWARLTGSVPTSVSVVSKLRWLAEREPDRAARLDTIMLPHDWLTWRLRDGGNPGGPIPALATTDRSEASGTGYWSPGTGDYLLDLVEDIAGQPLNLPAVASPNSYVAFTTWKAFLAPGCAREAAIALQLGLRVGDVVISFEDEGTVFAVSDVPSADGTGEVDGFADATGNFLPLVTVSNAARVIDSVAALLNISVAELDELALQAPSGAGGMTFLPYLEGEQTPQRPHASGVVAGMMANAMRPQYLARAAIEGVMCSLADCVDRLSAHGVEPGRIFMLGRGARMRAVQQIAPLVLGKPVIVPGPAEYAALGAARQAAWVLVDSKEPADWAPTPSLLCRGELDAHVRKQFGQLLSETAGWQDHQ